MANEKLSKELIVKLFDSAAGSYNTVARMTGYSLELNKETIETTSFDSAGWKSFLVDLKEWTVSGDGLVVRTTAAGYENYEELLVSLIGTDTTFILQLIDPDAYTDSTDGTGYNHEVGNAFLTSLSASGAVGDKQTYSVSFQGSGTLTHVLAKYDTQAEAFAAEASHSQGDVILVIGDIGVGADGYYSRTSDTTPANFTAAWTAYTI
jgi:TP901-1 family phage major tail protein